ARLRVFVSKHFFNYKYDYREEWLRFTRTMSDQGRDSVGVRAIRALCQIMESPGGVLWLRRGDGRFFPRDAWNAVYQGTEVVSADQPITRFLLEREWVIDVEEFGLTPEIYGALELPDWMFVLRGRFVVPLMLENDLLGFAVLLEPRARMNFNWEDSDLLKTVGRQVAIFLAQWETDQALNESRQFEAYTRMSTFLVHDLKNMAGQLSLIVKNAERHRDNPAFVDDVLVTVENSANKMRRLLDQLRTGRISGGQQIFDVVRAVRAAIEAKSSSKPVPDFETQVDECLIRADRDRFVSVLGHLIQNAQDATDKDNGSVVLRLRRSEDQVILTVQDNGEGMDAEFINHRMFQPFYSTKGASGMGIGAYDARQFVRGLGGDLTVESTPGKGTLVGLEIPWVRGDDG
ncbi:MAG: XrtA/PEP-CTERM system histidine kinase PrsK, partial [Gammaproteobacteria bacterium]